MAKRELPRLDSRIRDRVGSRDAKRLRLEGRLPAVAYGHQRDPLHLSVDAKVFSDTLHEGAHLVEMVADAQTEPCLIKDVQWDHLGRQIIHADLARVDLTEEVEVEVELELTGEPSALEEAGAVLGHPENTITVRCRADSIPDRITCDIGELQVGDSVTVCDLALPAGVAAVSDPELVLARITIVEELPEVEELVETAEGEEPEVIGRGGEEGEEAEEGQEEG